VRQHEKERGRRRPIQLDPRRPGLRGDLHAGSLVRLTRLAAERPDQCDWTLGWSRQAGIVAM
jgi:hypothetical protein